jgi:hypothetical protein
MMLLSTFSTNSINILAGINGSEVSQALIIALSVIINDLLYLPWPIDFHIPLHLLGGKAEVEFGGVWSAGMAHGSQELVERHLFSLYFMLPLVCICIGFMYHNWCVYFYLPAFPFGCLTSPSGILHEYSLATRFAMSQGWRLLSLGSRRTFPKPFFYSSSRKYSTLFCHVLNCLDWCLVLDTEYRGTCTIFWVVYGCSMNAFVDSIPRQIFFTRRRQFSSSLLQN